MIKRRTYTKENINKIIDLYKNKKYRIMDLKLKNLGMKLCQIKFQKN